MEQCPQFVSELDKWQWDINILYLYFWYKEFNLIGAVSEERGIMIANDIMESIRRRKVDLFGNTVFMTAIILDIFNTDKLSQE